LSNSTAAPHPFPKKQNGAKFGKLKNRETKREVAKMSKKRIPQPIFKQNLSKIAWKKIYSREYGVQYSEMAIMCLSGEKATELSKLCIEIENHYGAPQDIEWALAEDKICILQSRPVTAL